MSDPSSIPFEKKVREFWSFEPSGTRYPGQADNSTDDAIAHCSRVFSITALLLPCVLVIAGTTALILSRIPFQILADRARAMSASGQASFFSSEFHRAMQFRLRLIGSGNLLLALMAVLFRSRIARICEQVRRDFARLLADAQSAAARVSKLDRIGLLLLVAVAAWLRFRPLFQPMRADEAYTFLGYAARPFYIGLSFYNLPNNHLFHTLLVRCSYLIFGNHPWALRLPVFVSGLCLIPATYVASRSLYVTQSGLLASGLVACSSSLIEYSSNARGYILVCLVFTVSIAIAGHALRSKNWASWLLLAAVSIVGFYTIPIMLYPFGGILAWILLCSWKVDAIADLRGTVQGVCCTVALVVVTTLELYSPVFAVSGVQAVVANKWVKAVPLRVFAHDLPLSFGSTWVQWNYDVPRALVWMLIVAFCAALLLQQRCARHHRSLAVVMLGWILPLLVLQRVVPFERVWLFAVPLYLIVASAGVAVVLNLVGAKSAYAIAAVVVVTVGILGVDAQFSQHVYLSNEGRGLEQAAIDLKSELKQGDCLIAVPSSDAPLRYYFQKYDVPSSYLNAATGNRVLVLVNQVAGDNLQTVIDFAKRPDLKNRPATVVGTFDSVKLYEITKR